MQNPKGFTLLELLITIAALSTGFLLFVGCIGGSAYYFFS